MADTAFPDDVDIFPSEAALAASSSTLANVDGVGTTHSSLFHKASSAIVALEGRAVGTAVNIKEFGAAVDGTTDDTAAVQAALDACKAAGGGTIYFPPGTTLCTGTLTYDGDNLALVGATPGVAGSSTLRLTHATLGLDLGHPTVDKLGYTIRGLSFRGLNSTSPTTLVRMRDAYIVSISNCNFYDALHLVHMQTCGHVHIVDNTWNWNIAVADQIAILIWSSSLVNVAGNSMEGLASGSGDFVRISSASLTDSVTVTGNTVRQNHNAFVHMDDAATVRNVVIAANTQFDGFEAGVFAGGGTGIQDCVIVANVFNGRSGVSTAGIDLNSGAGTKTGLVVNANRVTEYPTTYDINGGTLWATATNTKARTTFDTTTVTTAQLAARVGALIDDLTTSGSIPL